MMLPVWLFCSVTSGTAGKYRSHVHKINNFCLTWKAYIEYNTTTKIGDHFVFN